MRSSIDWARLQVSVALPEAYKQANNLAKIKFDCLQLSVQIKDRLRNFHLSTKKKKSISISTPQKGYQLLRKSNLKISAKPPYEQKQTNDEWFLVGD